MITAKESAGFDITVCDLKLQGGRRYSTRVFTDLDARRITSMRTVVASAVSDTVPEKSGWLVAVSLDHRPEVTKKCLLIGPRCGRDLMQFVRFVVIERGEREKYAPDLRGLAQPTRRALLTVVNNL
jgi:hypothetical protein